MPIALTEVEMKLVTDAEVLIVKNEIIRKVKGVFEKLAENYRNIISVSSLDLANLTTAKISKGENYEGLPYVVLDYPRQFAITDVFAIRTFFWWGNFFSITLHLSGTSQQIFLQSIKTAIDQNLLEGWFIGCADTPWNYHFREDNYEAVKLEKAHRLSERSHIKIAKKIPLSEWENVEAFFEENFTFLIQLLRF